MKSVFKQFSVWCWVIAPICLACIQFSIAPERGSAILGFSNPYELQQKLGTYLTDISKEGFVGTLRIGYHSEIHLSNEYDHKGKAVSTTRSQAVFDMGSISIESTVSATFQFEMQRNWVPKIRYRGRLKFRFANKN